MNKKQISENNKWITNCVLALCNWQKVNSKKVDLENWKCGTHACFGGHLATWPEFKEMGVVRGSEGEPGIRLNNSKFPYSPDATSKALFGDVYMFFPTCPDEQHKTPHQIIVDRLENQIALLSE